MPIYEYKCDQCNHQFETLQKINDKPAKTCPQCNVDSLRKLISAAAFKLKGTGWYETDFKTKKRNQIHAVINIYLVETIDCDEYGYDVVEGHG